jgi:hypothetical protein
MRRHVLDEAYQEAEEKEARGEKEIGEGEEPETTVDDGWKKAGPNDGGMSKYEKFGRLWPALLNMLDEAYGSGVPRVVAMYGTAITSTVNIRQALAIIKPHVGPVYQALEFAPVWVWSCVRV